MWKKRKYVGKEAKEARKFGKLTWRCYICGDSCKIYSGEWPGNVARKKCKRGINAAKIKELYYD